MSCFHVTNEPGPGPREDENTYIWFTCVFCQYLSNLLLSSSSCTISRSVCHLPVIVCRTRKNWVLSDCAWSILTQLLALSRPCHWQGLNIISDVGPNESRWHFLLLVASPRSLCLNGWRKNNGCFLLGCQLTISPCPHPTTSPSVKPSNCKTYLLRGGPKDKDWGELLRSLIIKGTHLAGFTRVDLVGGCASQGKTRTIS